jgi:HEAT repeat protein
MHKKLMIGSLFAITLIAIAGWLGHGPLLVRYRVAQLKRAGDAEAGRSIERVARLGDAAVPALIQLLREDSAVAARAGQALARILDRYSENDPRVSDLGAKLAEAFAQFSPMGRQAALDLVEPLLAKGAEVDACRNMVRQGLKDSAALTRDHGVALAVRSELALEPEILPLMHDPEAGVRRSALLAVGPARDLLADDDLLPWLHDPDPEVRGLCETALRARGLQERDLMMGRLLTDPSPLKRLQVIDFLATDDRLDPNAWLQRLSQDPVPAVRASAARAAVDPDYHWTTEFTLRLRQMAEADPDGTVRQIAGDLLKADRH